MSDEMRTQPFGVLLDWILNELEGNQSIFGIHRSLFYIPDDPPYATTIFGHRLTTPIGPGAGPHTQLAQNILCAWLSGGRFIELKTVQIMDELEIPRPCIDMEDEGYNVEWSQELKLEQSAEEYIKAWALVHILRRVLGLEGTPFGTIFNMSLGYNLEGIQQPRMLRFMDSLADATQQVEEIHRVLEEQFPQFADTSIPAKITDNVTLSTMHGCPPEEMESICRYLLEERGLHTTIKLNPTLLGRERVLDILHSHLGFGEIHIPEAVFEHDLKYPRAVELIKTLQGVADSSGLSFGVKLSNTLAMANRRRVLPGDEMYMSGRALYPITMNLFSQLTQDLGTDLNVSYSAGADALNVTQILSAGALPVTIVSDLLKPGGYSRMLQCLENLEAEMSSAGASSLAELSGDRLARVQQEAERSLQALRYKRPYHPHGLPKVSSGLELFDCITAPCTERCAVAQDVPEYAWLIANRRYDEALEVILARNPLPGVTGYVCTHLCQSGCTRNNYDEPVAIRALKRYASEKGNVKQAKASLGPQRVAIVGSGPSGLAAAYYLTLSGVDTTVFEARDRAGGMLAIAPTFRLPEEVVNRDIERIEQLGVHIKLSHPVVDPPEQLLEDGYDAVYIATGAQQGIRLGIEGEDGQGVFQALDLLESVRRGAKVDLGQRVLVIGGGNSAMDAARTARRLVQGSATVVYRRTRQEMPATTEEIEGLLAEGAQLQELTSPLQVLLEDGHVSALRCIQNELGPPGKDGRRQPVQIPGSELDIEADAIVIAIGQRPDITFLENSHVQVQSNNTIVVDQYTGKAGERVYAGGDAVRGPAIIIEACADGRRAAETICDQLGIEMSAPTPRLPLLATAEIIDLKRVRAFKTAQHSGEMLHPDRRDGFDLVEATMTEADALAEAARCLQCSSLCDKCVEVCPNRANYAFGVTPFEIELPRLGVRQDELVELGRDLFSIDQSRQIVHVSDFCNECGNCATFCVRDGQPYLQKPRLFLDDDDFEAAQSNAFRLTRDADTWTVWRRQDGATSSLSQGQGTDQPLTYHDEYLRLTLSSPDLEILSWQAKLEFDGEIRLSTIAEMYVLLRGVLSELGFLPLSEN
jgi:putative selenate reductase